ncbi:hypothetical protein KUTeg_020040 [Tegillarca granosa]|uniref:Transglutaminase-like domain-containing protein n=1 Tax=Tegillarca granosa TaxID=220873 RepID=A0ABQ9EG75_TEGGR|nr:hypothetical protein KUTeg_020040 [Tegillarca granosa]
MPRRRSNAPATSSETSPKRRRYSLRVTRSRRKRLLGGDQPGRKPVLTEEEFWRRYALLSAEDKPGTSLKVSKVDLDLKPNRCAHHTRDYDQQDLILRRGQKFTLTVTFDREVKTDMDCIVLQFVTGDKPQESKGSLIRIPVDVTESRKEELDNAKDWSTKVEDVCKENVKVVITTPPDAIIGVYQLFIETTLKDDEKDRKRFEYEGEKIIILFNPWCEEDTVYMKDSNQREEYVLNDTGRIWRSRRERGFPWNFGQFDIPCLDAALYLLDLAELGDTAKTSPVSVVRVISSWANSMDNDGVLEGRWTSEYPKDCTKPSEWSGSVAILREYMKTKKTVMFGQCWVFSGLVTTLLRSLGIPTRSVTNFSSAHDTDLSMTIDAHYDEDGEEVDYMNDSVWNFHVWNESWFKRPDLPDGYDGWQAHDGTPQEVSEGVMRCGPASLQAIKEGHVYLNYDTKFVYSEVNGDRVKWKVKDDATMEVIGIDRFSVGQYISTKAVGSDARHDLTLDYKYAEWTPEERKVAKFVNRFSTRRTHNIYGLDTTEEINFKFNLPETTLMGDDFEVGVTISNTKDDEIKLRVKAVVVNAFYTGIPGRKVFTEVTEISVPAKGVRQLFRYCIDMTFQMPDTITAKEETKATIKFKNTTKIKLTNGSVHVEGSGLLNDLILKTKKVVQPGEDIEMVVTVKPKRSYYRKKALVVNLSFDQISDIIEDHKVKVVKAAEDSDSDDE